LEFDEKLPKEEIIRRSSEFSRIIKNGKRWKGKYLRIFFEEADNRRVGFAVSKHHGNAVKRNRIKRLLREIYRKRRYKIGKYRIIFMVEKDVVNLEISKLEKDLDFFINEKIGKNN
jgi:ribonuclease P protein component